MSLASSTLRPGFLVSLKTSISGNVSYRVNTIEAPHLTSAGELEAKWETERKIADPVEFEAAKKARSLARSAVTRVCAASAFGLLCPETAAAELEASVAEAREIAERFNATARLSRVSVYVITGRIAADDAEAVRAINSEVRDLLAAMESGIRNLDVSMVRDAANKARELGSMLSPEAAARVQIAVDAARKSARQIVKAGEEAAQAIDLRSLRAITEARTAFLDLDGEGAEIAAPAESARAVDFEPAPTEEEYAAWTADQIAEELIERDESPAKAASGLAIPQLDLF